MRWTLGVGLTAAVVSAATASATASPRPVLRLGTPNAVRGSHFKAHELVRVVFTSDVSQVRLIRVSATGSFATELPAPADSCSGMLIRATGASGDIAWIAKSRGLCPPPSASGAQSASTAQSGGATAPSPSASGTQSGGATTPPPSGSGSQSTTSTQSGVGTATGSPTGGLPDPHGPATINPTG